MKIKYIFILLAVFSLALSCNKDSENGKDYNMLKVTSGSNPGFTQTYAPNQGYWAVVSATAKYVHLVFGDTDNMTVDGKDIMSILFYDEGNDVVNFPSAQGQHVNIGITVEGIEQYYSAENAQLSVEEFTDNMFRGRLSGDFSKAGTGETISLTMDIEIEMAQL